jgi:hypothetical protein
MPLIQKRDKEYFFESLIDGVLCRVVMDREMLRDVTQNSTSDSDFRSWISDNFEELCIAAQQKVHEGPIRLPYNAIKIEKV